MTTWTCLFLGGPLDGQWIECEKYRAVQTHAHTERPISWMAEPLLGVMTMEDVTTYVPRRFWASGWRFPLDIYVHQSLGIVEPQIPIGTVVPGGIVGMATQASPLCHACYGRPVPGWPFCASKTAGIPHAKIVAELAVMEQEL
jgi:hypothetical protein